MIWSRREDIVGPELKRRKWFLIVSLVLGIVGITILRDAVSGPHAWGRNVIQQLYILPVIVAAIYFDWRGGLAAVAVAALCSRHVIAGRLAADELSAGVPQLINLVLAASATGLLATRERKHRESLERTTRELGSVYNELQENFERMKRSERLYALGQMSAGLSHEIRNPLASIEGAAAILQQEPCSEDRRVEFLDIIQKESRRLNRMLTNFLEFARPRPPQYETADLGQILDSVVSLTGHAVGKRALVLRKVVPPDLPKIECDPEQLKQVILNLALNAIHAMPEGGEIVLSVYRQDGKVTIDVRDQGCGISPEHLDNIFDPFFTTKEDGTGLGLPVSYQIVSNHGGVLTAKINPDRGMTFSILLPLKQGRVL